jgi:DNA-binding Xre family transcriptional regulator
MVTTLEKICERLDCQPGDILERTADAQEEAGDDANASSPW